MPDDRAVKREYEIDWTTAEGDVFYSVFSRDPYRFVEPVDFNPKWPVYRGWDFGVRNSACVWVQLRPNGQVVALREISPVDIDTTSFRNLVLYLSGQPLVIGGTAEENEKVIERYPKAVEYIEQLKEVQPQWFGWKDTCSYDVPFFPSGTRFEDYSGAEALKRYSFEREPGVTSDAQNLAAAGIHLNMQWQPVSYGCRILRSLQLERSDGKRGLIIHPQCTELILGMGGGLVYPKSTEAEPLPEDKMDVPRKDGRFEHPHDALRYVVTQLVEPQEVLRQVENIVPRREDPTPQEEELERVGDMIDSIEWRHDWEEAFTGSRRMRGQ